MHGFLVHHGIFVSSSVALPNIQLAKRTYIVVWVVNHRRLPFALVLGILDHWRRPLTATNCFTGWVSWRVARKAVEERRKRRKDGQESTEQEE